MAKLPSIQFYPGDWRKDPGVQALSFHDRGVWFEILLIMFESSDRGKLLLNGHPMPDDALARLLGLDKQILTKTINTLVDFGVASRDTNTGALMSRRMVRDEDVRKIRQNVGKLGGNPRLLNQKDNQNPTTQDNQKSTPSSSSSTSTSFTKENINIVGEGGAGGGNGRDVAGDTLPDGGKSENDFSLEGEKPNSKAKRKERPLPDDRWLDSLKTHPAYEGIDVAREVAKCRLWCETKRKAFSRERIMQWLNRAERPLKAGLSGGVSRQKDGKISTGLEYEKEIGGVK